MSELLGTHIEKMAPRWTWQQIEAAVLRIPLQRFTSALRVGVTEEDGCQAARLRVADDLRRELLRELQERPKP